MFKHLPAVRSWIYGILTPLGLLLAGYGITSEAKWALWASLITAALNGGVAFTNRPTGPNAIAGLTEIQNQALAAAISMMQNPEVRPEAFPPAVEAPPGETPYEGD
jgi:hypothetical protein